MADDIESWREPSLENGFEKSWRTFNDVVDILVKMSFGSKPQRDVWAKVWRKQPAYKIFCTKKRDKGLGAEFWGPSTCHSWVEQDMRAQSMPKEHCFTAGRNQWKRVLEGGSSSQMHYLGIKQETQDNDWSQPLQIHCSEKLVWEWQQVVTSGFLATPWVSCSTEWFLLEDKPCFLPMPKSPVSFLKQIEWIFLEWVFEDIWRRIGFLRLIGRSSEL